MKTLYLLLLSFLFLTFEAHAQPAAITGNLEICNGATTTLANDTASGKWTSGNTGVATVDTSSGVVTGVAPGTSIITYAVVSGSVTATVTVNAPASITGMPTICTGLTDSLSSATGGGTWTSSNTSFATIDAATGVVTAIATGTSTISYTLENTCYQTFVVSVDPVPGAIGYGALTVCEGSSLQLSNDVPGGNWSVSNDTLASFGPTFGLVTGKSQDSHGGTQTWPFQVFYSVCGSVDMLDLTLTSLPELYYPTKLCIGDTATLTCDPAGLVGWKWQSMNVGAGRLTVDSNSGFITADTAGIVQVSYSLAPTIGCNNFVYSDNIYVISGTGFITGDSAICVDENTVLSVVADYGSWSSSNTGVATITSVYEKDHHAIINGVSAGTATITWHAGSPSACISTVVVTVNPLPEEIAGSPVVVVTNSITLTNATGGGTWSSSNAAAATISVGGVVYGIATGTTVITYTAPGGCYVTKVIEVIDPFAVAPCETAPFYLCDSIYSYCPGLKFTFPGAPTAATFSWSPTIPATKDTAGGVVAFTFTAVPTMGIYTVTATLGTYTVTAKIRLVVGTGGVYPCSDFKPSCTSCATDIPFKTIWSYSLTPAYIDTANAGYYYIPNHGSGYATTCTIEANPGAGSVFLMGNLMQLQVKLGDAITLDSCHIFGSNSNSWYGISVRTGSGSSGSLKMINNTLIENVKSVSTTAAIRNTVEGGVAAPAGGANIIECDGAIINHNYVGLNLSTIDGFTSTVPVVIANSVFTNRDFCPYQKPESTDCRDFYPFSWPTVSELKRIDSGGYSPIFGADQYSKFPFGATGMKLTRLGKTASGTFYNMVIGDTSSADRFNMFDAMPTDISSTGSNLISYNNVFRLATNVALTATTINPTPVDNTLEFSTGSLENTHNRFYNCSTAVSSLNIYNLICRDMEISANNYYYPGAGSATPSTSNSKVNGTVGLNVSNSTANFRFNEIRHNRISNIYSGMLLVLPTGATCAGDIDIKDNVISGLTAEDTYEYAVNGIQLNGVGTCTLSGTVTVSGNTISGLVSGIIASVKNVPVVIDSNEIVIKDSYDPGRFNRVGIFISANNNSTRNQQITVTRNHVYGDINCHVNFQTPAVTLGSTSGAIDGYRGIQIEQTGTVGIHGNISCNYVHDLNLGFNFVDTSVLDWKNNVIARTKYGMALQYIKHSSGNYTASIGDQGDTACGPADNYWCPATEGDETGWPGWSDAEGTWQTYTSGVDPLAPSSKLFVRPDAGYTPTVNGTRDNTAVSPAVTGIAYSTGTASLVNSSCEEYEAAVACYSCPSGAAERKAVLMSGSDDLPVFSLYPNPATSTIILKADKAGDLNVNVTIRNYQGSVIYNEPTLLDGGAAGIVLPRIAPGLYLVTVTDEKGFRTSFSLVIQ